MARKRGGIGAVGKAMECFFHPSKEVEAKCLQEGKTYKSHVLEDAIIIGRETTARTSLRINVASPSWTTIKSMPLSVQT
eukprot:scaffold6907_cov83-Alexandrium_tamarense.AAC.1